MYHAADDLPGAGICRNPITKLPVDDRVTAAFDRGALFGQRTVRTRQRRQPLDYHVLQGRIVFQGRQHLQLEVREPRAALGQQGGNVHDHVLPGVEEVRHKDDFPQPAGRQLGDLIGNVGVNDGEECRQHHGALQSGGNPFHQFHKAAIGVRPRAAVADDQDPKRVGRSIHDRSPHRERK